MTMEEAVRARHSVRAFQPRPLEEAVRERLVEEVAAVNRESGLHIQLICGHPEAFSNFMAHYGGFGEVDNYLALVGPDREALDEACGYYGERLVLLAETLGLGSCWIGGTFNRREACYEASPGEALCLIIALGYPAQEGKAHRSKKPEQVSRAPEPVPEWFRRGVEFALLAPTAMNQQRFRFHLIGDNGVFAETSDWPFARVDLGIAKYHFELGAGRENFHWLTESQADLPPRPNLADLTLSAVSGALLGAGIYYARRGKQRAVLLASGALVTSAVRLGRSVLRLVEKRRGGRDLPTA